VDDPARSRSPTEQRLPDADARLLEQIRSGDAEAGHQFVREHYTAIYRYLLYLTGQTDLAEDLTQETFLQGWRRLETFQRQGSLRSWLHRIAHREFLHMLQRRQSALHLEGMTEVAAPDATARIESVELREVIDRLPLEQRQVVLLHDLEGYTSAEIALIVSAPASTVRRRLAEAREQLRQELGEGDLAYVNEPLAPMRQWAWLPLDQIHALEARLALKGRAGKEEAMERREFLRHAAAGAMGLMLPEAEKDIVDGRLTQKATLAFKGTALSDVCEHLRAETGVHLAAGPSVADEKVTLFCDKTPLREVMRQLSRPFGYTWLRSGTAREYRYELVQDLRSQLLEEELRNRDRHAALLALEKEIERYRPYLNLSPDEALQRARTAPPEEKKRLEHMAGLGWGPMQIYFRLTPHEQTALRAGQMLTFSQDPRPGDHLLPAEVARGVLQAFRDRRVVRSEYGFGFVPVEPGESQGLPATAVPEVRALVTLWISQSELGQFAIDGHSGAFSPMDRPRSFFTTFHGGPYAVGRNLALLNPETAGANVRSAQEPALRARVTVEPGGDASAAGAIAPREPKVGTDDVLEALHRATGMNLVADHYTRLYQASTVSVRDVPLHAALDQLAGAMRLRWRREEGWFQFRSITFYNDRTKEVPNRLLARWATSRRKHGFLTLDDLVEIAQLPDASLDGAEMAEGARERWGLEEWELGRSASMRPHLRFLGEFTAGQRQEMMGAAGLPFIRMSPLQQQQFLSFALPSDNQPLQAYLAASDNGPFQLQELQEAALRVEYTQPGWFQWGSPALAQHWIRWVVPIEPGRGGRRVLRPPVCEQTREAALAAVRRIDPRLRAATLHRMPDQAPSGEATRTVPVEEQIFPTELGLTIVYVLGSANARPIRTLHGGFNNWQVSW
jgi:RNA polymerase sigma-70 factor, ECF subfamily